MTHLTHEDLIAWRDSPDAENRERVVAHLAECEECSAALAELVRNEPSTELVIAEGELVAVSDTPLYFKPADFEPQQQGYAIRKDPRTAKSAFGPFAWKAWAPIVGAAAVVSAIFVFVPSPQPAETDTRGSLLEVTARASAPTSQTEIEWHGGATATEYQVMLRDEDGGLVFGLVTAASRASLPSEILARLHPGQRYTWTVTALDVQRQPITSATRSFVYDGPTK